MVTINGNWTTKGEPIMKETVLADGEWVSEPNSILFEIEQVKKEQEVLTKTITELFDKGDVFLRPPLSNAEPREANIKDFSSSDVAMTIKEIKERLEDSILLLNEFKERLDR